MKLRALRAMFLLGMLAALDTHSAGVPQGHLTASSPDLLSAPELLAPARGRLIVKYRDSVAVCVHCWHKHRQGSALPTSDQSRSLDDLHARYAVRSVTPLFRRESEEKGLGPGLPSVGALRQQHRQKLAAARGRFALRSKRLAAAAPLPDLHHVYTLEIPRSVDPQAAAADFQKDPHVEYAEPDYLVRADFLPRDPYFRSSGAWRQGYADLWGLQEDRLDMESAWNLSRGRGVVVAVLDTGVDYNHPDLASNIWRNPGEVAGNGVDDDANGFVDDVRGWDFVTCKEFTGSLCRTPSAPDNTPLDDNGHGTHVAGTIAATGNNGRGIVGVALNARIMPVKGLNRQGNGLTSGLAAGLLYAGISGADVINNSWGCGFCPTIRLFTDTLQTLHGLGVVSVFAAGNSASDVRYRSPHNLRDPEPIVVAASDQDDEPGWFSSFGAAVDVAAPGAGKGGGDNSILSLRSAACALCESRNSEFLLVGKEYLRLQGTSMAAPHVSGLAALLLARRPTLSNDEVRRLLRMSADDIHEPGYDLEAGGGRINARRALTTGQPLEVKIATPLDLTMAGAGPLTVTGTAAGADLDRHQLLYREEVGGEWQPVTAPSTAEVRNGELGSFDLSGLPPGWKALRLRATTRGGLELDDVIYVGKQLASRKITSRFKGTSIYPDISGDLVVWSGDYQIVTNRSGIAQELGRIYLRDLATGKTMRLSDAHYGGTSPKVSGNLVVWHDLFIGRPNALYACRYDRETGTCPVQKVFTGPLGRWAMSGDRIAFNSSIQEGPHLRPFIRVLDLATETKRDFPFLGLFDLDGDHLVVERIFPPAHPGPQSVTRHDVFLYDLARNTERRITDTDRDETNVRVKGRRIFYQRSSPPSPTLATTADWILYDIDTGKERILRTGLSPTLLSHNQSIFSGNRIVWDLISDIVVYDVDTGETQAIVVHPLVLRNHAGISGERVVWMEITNFELLSGEIYMASLPGGE